MRTALIVVVIVNANVVKISSDPLSSPNLVRIPQSGRTKEEELLIRSSHNGEEKYRDPSV